MYEHRHEKLLSRRQFWIRVVRHGGMAVVAVVVALAIGVVGYHVTVQLPWIDALLDASMILGGMGPISPITTTSGKLFASAYALFSGLFFIAVTGILMAPFLHRLIHIFHLGDHSSSREDR